MNLNFFQCQNQVISYPSLFPGRGGIFFDRDGTIIEEKNYLSQVKDLYLITNQAGIAHGYFTEKQLRLIHLILADELLKFEIKFRAVFHCPHHPQAELPEYRSDCFSRKPKPGLLYQAARFDKLNLKHSYIIGDKLSDLEAERKVGAKTILVLTGYGPVEFGKIQPSQKPDFVALNINAAADWIINQERGNR